VFIVVVANVEQAIIKKNNLSKCALLLQEPVMQEPITQEPVTQEPVFLNISVIASYHGIRGNISHKQAKSTASDKNHYAKHKKKPALNVLASQ